MGTQLVFDNFPGANGNVVGTTAVIGGVWQPTSAPYSTPVITSHLAVGALNDGSGAQISAGLALVLLQGPWWLRFQVLLGTKSITSKNAGAWVGDDNVGPYFGANCAYQAQQSVGEVQIAFGQINASPSMVNVFSVDTTLIHEVVCQFDGNQKGTLRIFWDDLLVATATGVAPDPTMAPVFIFSPECGASSTAAAFAEVELGVGYYYGAGGIGPFPIGATSVGPYVLTDTSMGPYPIRQ